MAATERIITEAEKRQLEAELARLEGPEHDAIVERIKVARGFGDLSENSEYDDAKEDEAKNAAAIAELRAILATARVVDADDAAAEVHEVGLSTKVTVADERGKETSFIIVGTTQAKSLEHKISSESPIGAALMGHGRGDTVSYVVPSGKVKTLVIKDIERYVGK